MDTETTAEWIKKMWYIYTMGFYSVIKKNKLGICRDIDGTGIIMLSKLDLEKQILHILCSIWN